MVEYVRMLRLFSRDVRLLLVAGTCFGIGYFGIYSLLLNLYLLRLGYGMGFIGLVNAAGPLAFGLLSPSAGMAGRRWSSRRAMLTGMVGVMLGIGMVPFAEFVPSTWQAPWLVIAHFLVWAFGAFYVVNVNPFLMNATAPVERDYAFSVYFAVLSVAGFVGSIIGGVLPSIFALLLDTSVDLPAPYRFPFWFAAALYVPAILAVRATRQPSMGETNPEIIKPTPQIGDEGSKPAPGVMAYSPYRLILIFALVAVLRTTGEWAPRVFFNAYLDSSLGTSTLLVGLLLALGQLMGLTALLAPLAIKRWGKVRTVGSGMLLVACSLLPLALVPHRAVAGLSYITIIALAVLTNPAYNVFSQDLVAPPWRPTISGAMFMAFGISVSVVALGGGYLAGSVGYSAVFLLAALFTASGGLFFLYYFRKPRGELAYVHSDGAGTGVQLS